MIWKKPSGEMVASAQPKGSDMYKIHPSKMNIEAHGACGCIVCLMVLYAIVGTAVLIAYFLCAE